jgi:signal transduction histidine kinase
MSTEPTKSQPERAQTDESLRAEREKADQATATSQTVVESDADSVLDRARENADAVLVEARAKADEHIAERTRVPGARAVLQGERMRADEVVRVDRASADERLERERAEGARALARLLPFERETTDRYLLTERRRSDDAVRHRDDFLGMVSHDLRNLLGGIVMGTTVISEAAPDDAQGKALLVGTARIQRYAARMNRMIGDLLDVVSIDAGRLGVVRAPGDLRASVAEASDAFHAAAMSKGITLEIEKGGPLPGEFDQGRILQVLANLITNAIKFSPEGGRIVIRAERAGADLAVSVRDTGCGISPDVLDHVFERFWQAGRNDRRGTGLGLYIARCIVEAHGGSIWAESEVGAGSTFSLSFPAIARGTA